MSGEPRVDAPAGVLTGLRRGAVAEFRGIPYAEPPVGPLRWRAPVRRPRFDGGFAATAWGATPQRVPFAEVTAIPEPSIPGDDILTLNVFAPAEGTRLPVLVWIHGGGYAAGSAASPWYDGRSFVRDGVVVVTIAYRLAFDGFGLLPEAEPNRGMLDWICALEWVRDNISAFGGDPHRVTVAGQSAGGGAVLALLACERAQPLFDRAISLSGIDLCQTPDEARQVTEAFARELGVPATIEGFAGVSDTALQRAARRRRDAQDGVHLMPVSGDELLPDGIRAGLARSGLDKPLLLGSTADEFRDPVATDVLFRSTCTRVTRARRDAAGTWLYSFDWDSPVTGGATHCADLPFFFDVLDAPGVREKLGAAPQPLATFLHGEVVRFVHGADPAWAPARGRTGDDCRIYDTVPSTRSGRYDDVADMHVKGPT
ncbi:carboxylesterase family protein [Pseudonocardia sp. CA-107938]|uniref:carboxylesterase family protein n=1 Tax=Pseudonocardia sp. CA-107938 TaxID=3240021 RepID=UPI003D8D130C